MNSANVKEELQKMADPQKRDILLNYFKTQKGGYGEGDLFMGVVVPKQRNLVKKHKSLPLSEIDALLRDPYHECRLTALLFLVNQFNKASSEDERTKIYQFYLDHIPYINNWDLVDLSARDIVGGYLWNKPRKELYQFAIADNIWLQRISIISTYYFITRNDLNDTFEIAVLLLNHEHDLIHKAVGWMLREAGKREFASLYNFLTEDARYKRMPRTMLRYAIEKFPEALRHDFLTGRI